MKRFRWLILLLIVALIGGYGYNTWQSNNNDMEKKIKAQETKQCTFARMINKQKNQKADDN